MGWVSGPHICELPMTAHGSVAKVGAYYQCDDCYATWKVQARVIAEEEGFYMLTWIRRVGDYLYTRSWQNEC